MPPLPRPLIFLCALILPLTLPRIAAADEPFTFRRPSMGTVWTIKLFASDETKAATAAEAAFARIEQLNTTLSDYNKDSALSRLSATAGTGQAVPVAGDLLAILTLSQKAAEESAGVFDITIGPCAQLWRTAKRTRRLPSPDAIAAARAATGWENLVLDTKNNTALLKKPGMLLDTGGIAKGYAQDEAMKVLREKHAVTSALIDAGGAILVSDPPPGRTAWNLQITKTREDDPAPVLAVANTAVDTSGDLHQTVEIEGRHYSHIIDKQTGLGMTTSTQATVVVPGGALSDWLATALCLMGPEKGIAWIKEKHPEAEARIVQSAADGLKIKETPGFERLVLKPVK